MQQFVQDIGNPTSKKFYFLVQAIPTMDQLYTQHTRPCIVYLCYLIRTWSETPCLNHPSQQRAKQVPKWTSRLCFSKTRNALKRRGFCYWNHRDFSNTESLEAFVSQILSSYLWLFCNFLQFGRKEESDNKVRQRKSCWGKKKDKLNFCL